MNKHLLRGAAIGRGSVFQLPGKRYLDDYGVLADKTRDETLRNFETYKRDVFEPRIRALKTVPIQFSPLVLGMFNGTLDTEDVIEIPLVLVEVLQKGLVSKDGVKCVKVATIYGKFKKAFEYTEEYGDKVFEKVPPSKLSAIEFTLKVGGTGASVTLFKTGRIRFSGGYITGTHQDAKKILKYINDSYFQFDQRKTFTINNNTTTFKVNMGMNKPAIFHIFDPKVTRNVAYMGDYAISAEFYPERNANKKTPFLYIHVKGAKNFTLVCTATGKIVIEGTSDVVQSYEVAKKLLEAMKNADLMVPENAMNIKVANKQASRVGRRLNMMPAPEVTRRGTTCPVEKRPVPYSFQGKCPEPNHYVRPNKQGQPCCYRIPKKTEYMANRVARRYSKAGIRIPENVRKLFGIENSRVNLPTNVSRTQPNIRTYTSSQSGFKIDSRQCSRYTKVGLVDIAKRLGLQVPRVITKPDLCKMIENATQAQAQAQGQRKNKVTSNLNGLKLGDKYCMSYKKQTLLKYARAMGLRDVTDDMSKEQICKEIGGIRARIIKVYGSNKNVTPKVVADITKLLKNASPGANKNAIIKKYANRDKEINNLLTRFI